MRAILVLGIGVAVAVALAALAYKLARRPVERCIQHCRAQGLAMSSYIPDREDGAQCICLVEPVSRFDAAVSMREHGLQNVFVEVYDNPRASMHVRYWRTEQSPDPTQATLDVHELFGGLSQLLAEYGSESAHVSVCLSPKRDAYLEMACSWCLFEERDGIWNASKCQ